VPLCSRLFRSSRRLQQCSLYDHARICPQAKGDHIYRVQIALTRLDYEIAAAEVISETYGLSMGAAIIAYAKDSGSGTPGLRLPTDNFIGKTLICALDQVLANMDRSAQLIGINTGYRSGRGLDLSGSGTLTA
jgi:hypothetical protein